MRKRLRIATGLFAGLLLAAAALLLISWRAWHRVPEFYDQALALDVEQQAEASRQLETRLTTLYNDVQDEGEWQSIFTEKQINGWLALDLSAKHGDLLPAGVHHPRVQVAPEMVTVAARVDNGEGSTVYSLGIDVYVSAPNEIAFRLRRVRAGAFPLPMATVLDKLNAAAGRLEQPIRWAQIDGDPVALVSITPPRDEDQNVLVLEKLELHEGEIYVSGRTHPRGRAGGPQSSVATGSSANRH